MTYSEAAEKLSITGMDIGLHKLMNTDYSETTGATIEHGFVALYHEDGLYSVKCLKNGIIHLVHARNPHEAIVAVWRFA